MQSTTPEPTYVAPNEHNVTVNNRVEIMQYAMKARVRAAALRAHNVIPGPIGELVQRELLAMDEFGWIPGARSLMARLLEAVERLPCDTTITAQSRTRGGFITTASETK